MLPAARHQGTILNRQLCNVGSLALSHLKLYICSVKSINIGAITGQHAEN
jgi:hypothetical protein